MLVMVREVFRLLVMVTDFGALVVPKLTVPKDRVMGLAVTGSCPTPVRLIVCGLLIALSTMVTVPRCLPAVVGVNVTVTVHVPCAGILVPQVLTCVYPAPHGT